MREKNSEMWLDGMMGLIVGDALGVPVQFFSRQEIKEKPVETMEGYGTYNMPEGTWSDDSSMALATLASIREKKEIDPADIMMRFVKWLIQGAYTPYGKAFDVGNTCDAAITRFMIDRDARSCGETGEFANGNGALMRILPVCLYVYEKQKEESIIEEEGMCLIHEVASLTHHHLRSNMACGLYYFMVKNILEYREMYDLQTCMQKGIEEGISYNRKDVSNVTELSHFQ